MREGMGEAGAVRDLRERAGTKQEEETDLPEIIGEENS